MRILLLLLFYSITALAEDEPKKPSLGNCSEYSDYYIYKCQPFKCKLPIGNLDNTYREMETIGYEEGYCVHKYSFIIRAKNIQATDFKMKCKLTEKGKLEMSNLFTQYKKGKTSVYINPPYNELLSKECTAY